MPEENLHIVHQQIVEAKLPDEVAAHHFQNQVSRLFAKKLPDMLDQVCNELNLENDLLYVPQLAVDIGTLPLENWEQLFIDRCKAQIIRILTLKREAALSKKTSSLANPKARHDQLETTLQYDDIRFLIEKILTKGQEEEQLFTEDQQVLIAFFEFLNTGQTQLSIIPTDFRLFEKKVIKLLQKIKTKEAFLELWQEAVLIEILAIERLSKQFSLQFIQQFFYWVWGFQYQQWQFLFTHFQELMAKEGFKILDARQNYWFASVLLYELLQQEKAIDLAKIQKGCMAQWEKIVKDPKINSKKSSIPDITVAEFKEQEQKIKEKQPADFFIENGGLIIVAPFLPALFKELKLLDGNNFVNTGLQEKAIQLTQFLVTGLEASPEHLLPLNKILCAWPLQKPLLRESLLSLKEKEEGIKMLEAVIKHWGKIGQSSIEALQETFLQRKATLKFREGYHDWLLQIERKDGIDILIDKIPWTISLIKFPWMQEKIMVEWV